MTNSPTWPTAWIDDETYHDLERAQVAIAPIPYEATTTYRKGCQHGPLAILKASEQLEYFDVELGAEVCLKTAIAIHPPIADVATQPDLSPEAMVKQVEAAIAPLLQAGKFVIALGGEHGITAGVVAAYVQHFGKNFTVVQIDAHGDLRHCYQGSIYNHACVMRRLVDMGLPTLPVAIRSVCQEEVNLIRDRAMPVVWDHEIVHNPDWIADAIAQIKTAAVFLTIDLDGLDPGLLPGVGTPQPGGLSWYNATQFIRQLFAHKTVLGCDVMELAPLQDAVGSEFTAAKLVYKLIGYYTVHAARGATIHN